MESNDIFQLLKKCGFQKDHIEKFLERMDGNDLISVVNAAREKNLHYIDSLMKKYKVLEWIQPLDPKNLIDEYLFISEGFNYHISLPHPKLGEQMMTWLEDNDIPFTAKNDQSLAVKCETRDIAYKVDKKINDLAMRHKFVRDNKVVEKTFKKIINMPLTEHVVGEMVHYKGKKYYVKIPNGPHGTIGLIINKRLTFVDKDNLE